MLHSLQEDLILKYGINFQKRFGQNYLVDSGYARDLVDAAKLGKSDIVIEIGTGMGAITTLLAEKAGHVVSFEIDDEVYKLVKKELEDLENVTLINQDILHVEDISTFFDKPAKGEYKVVASLPYNISKKVINYFLQQQIKPISMSFIIQHEVAEDYAAKPPKATFLSNLTSLYGEAKYIRKIPPDAFFPAPKVNSAIIHIDIDEKKSKSADEKLIKFIKQGFSQPRKNILNVLNSFNIAEKSEIEQMIAEIGIDRNLRAENLSVEDWRKLYKFFNPNQD